MPITFIARGPMLLAPYQGGPGDIVSGAEAWWGLRAYTSASIGGNAVRLRRDSDDAEQDFVTVAGGGLNTSSISSFKGAANLFVVTLYDQTGNGFHVTQATLAQQPAFTLSGLGSKPIVTCVGTSGLISAGTLTVSQPLTMSWVGNHNGPSGQQSYLLPGGNLQLGCNFDANNQAFLYAGVGVDPKPTVSDDAWHALQGVCNGSSSDVNVDGSVNTGNPGSAGCDAAIYVFVNASSAQRFDGSFVEAGIWGVAFSGANSTAMSTQQHAYWGF